MIEISKKLDFLAYFFKKTLKIGMKNVIINNIWINEEKL